MANYSRFVCPFLLLALTLPGQRHARGDDAPALRRIHLRIQWSTEQPRLWHGVVEISGGRLESPCSLGTDADEPGTVWIDGDAVWLQRRAPRSDDGFDVTAFGNAESVVSITLQPSIVDAPAEKHEIPLASLDEAAATVPIDGGSLTVARRPGDQLAVETGRAHEMYESGERYSATVALNLIAPANESKNVARLQWTIAETDGTETLEKHVLELPADLASVPVATTLPQKEGVYALAFEWTRDEQPVLRTNRQLVVLPRRSRRQSLDLGGRLIGAYVPRPFETGNANADWTTFHTAANQLTAQLTQSGCNAALVTAAAEGSAIYPSALLQATPCFDGTASDRNPERKDGLELLYREFARKHLVLIPELQFCTPLPELERLIASQGDAARGIELIGRDGRSWRETRSTQAGLAPYYNPLDPRVQDAVIAVVEELVQRYRSQPAFAGIAIQLSGDGYLQFPGLGWGYDDATIERFAKETGTTLPPVAAGDRTRSRYEYLTTAALEHWAIWRCEQLAAFHVRLANVVTSASPHARCVFSTQGLLESPNVDESLAMCLKAGSKPESILRPKGLDFARYDGVDRLTVLRPILSGDGIEPTANGNPAFDTAFSKRCNGILVVPPRGDAEVDSSRVLAQAIAVDRAGMVFDADWAKSTGEGSAHLRALVRTLPMVPFHSAECPQPITLLTAVHANKTYVVAVNRIDGNATAELTLGGSGALQGVALPNRGPLAVKSEAAGIATMSLDLAAHSVWAGELTGNVRVTNAAVQIAPEVLAQLEQRLKELDGRLAALQASDRAGAVTVENGGFELAVDGAVGLPGWDVILSEGAAWSIDTQERHSGEASLLLTSESNDEARLAAPVTVGSHHMLTLGVWMRSDRDDTAVRLGIDAAIDAEIRRQFADVQVGTEWRRYLLRVKDIPVATVQDGRVTLALRSPARLWIDDADVRFDRLSDDDLRQLTKLFSAVSLAWQDKRYADCQRLLKSYWGEFLFEEPSVESDVESPTRTTRRDAGYGVN